MKRLAEVYTAQFKVIFGRFVQYRVSMGFWILSLMLSPVVFTAVWSAVAQSQGGEVAGLTAGDFAAYFVLQLFVNHLTFAWTMWYWQNRVQEGSLSYALLRPSHIFHQDFAENLTYKLVTTPFILLTALAMFLTFAPTGHITLWSLLAFIPALLLAFLLRFMFDMSISMGAFWLTDNTAFNGFYFFAMTFMSGQSAPLILFPVWFQQLASLFPFRWMIEFPILVVLGRISLQGVLTGYAIQCVWILVGAGLLSILWRRGLVRFSGVGL